MRNDLLLDPKHRWGKIRESQSLLRLSRDLNFKFDLELNGMCMPFDSKHFLDPLGWRRPGTGVAEWVHNRRQHPEEQR